MYGGVRGKSIYYSSKKFSLLDYVKDFLGHNSISSTEIYATPDSKKQREEILKNAENINTKKRYSSSKKESLDNWLKNNMK